MTEEQKNVVLALSEAIMDVHAENVYAVLEMRTKGCPVWPVVVNVIAVKPDYHLVHQFWVTGDDWRNDWADRNLKNVTLGNVLMALRELR